MHPANQPQKELQDQLSNRDWQQFLDRAIHDLSSPLRVLGTSAGLLSESHGDALNDDARRLVEGMMAAAGRMDSILNGLSDYSMTLNVDSRTVGPVPLQAVVVSALDTMKTKVAETGARVDCSALPTVTGSWDRLSVLFRNLLENALTYRSVAAPQVMISAEREGTDWRFAVQDNGSGIEAQYRDRIFLPFERLNTSHKNHAGLGLAVCKRIVESHGGRIWVESKVGHGSVFFFTLPASQA